MRKRGMGIMNSGTRIDAAIERGGGGEE